MPGQHGRMDLPHANSHELLDMWRHDGHRSRKDQRLLPDLKRRREENVLITKTVGGGENVRAMLKTAAQIAIGHAEVFVIVAAQSREPRYFRRSSRGTDRDLSRSRRGLWRGHLGFNCGWCAHRVAVVKFSKARSSPARRLIRSRTRASCGRRRFTKSL